MQSFYPQRCFTLYHIHTQIGLQYFAQGHFRMQSGGAGDQTTGLLVDDPLYLLSHGRLYKKSVLLISLLLESEARC